MNAFGFYAPVYAWLALLAVPLVLFYFLKLKRPRKMTPSLVLWRQVMNDSRVNSPFQRFKRNVLLLIQLFLLALLVLAATQPYWHGKASRAKRLPILVDCSASMAALDKAGGSARLDAARAKLREIVNGMLPDQEFCIISFGRSAHKLADFTNNKRVLLDALAQLKVEDVPGDLESALRVAQAVGRTSPFDQVMLFSDGNLPAQVDFELPFTLSYQKLPPGGQNFGITSLNAQRSPDGAWDVFVRVECSAEAAETPATVELKRDGERVRAETVTLGRGQAQRLIFHVSSESACRLEVNLASDGFDSLASDNRAYLELPAARSLWVFAPASLASYRHALEALPGLRLFPDESGRSGEAVFDLVVTDRPEDRSLDAKVALYVGMVPDAVSGRVGVAREGTTVVDWRRTASALQHVDLTDLLLLEDPRLASDTGEGELESLGFETLVHGGHGPVLLEKRTAGKDAYYFLVHTDHSTFPYRVGFPILVSNLVRQASEAAGLTEMRAALTGVLPPVKLAPNKSYSIEGPDGSKHEERSDAEGALAGIPAPWVGEYSIFDGSDPKAVVGASLLSTHETSLATAGELTFSENLAVSADRAPARVDRALSPTIALIALAVLLFEWLYYHRSAGWFVR